MSLRKALASHSTPTVDKAWDGPGNRTRLKNDGDAPYYRKAHAWVDPEADEETKAAYRFIHHQVDAEGVVGAANVRGCIQAIAVLNGARGGTTIPSADRRGVYNHVAKHLRDADLDPAPLRSLRYDRHLIPWEDAEIRSQRDDSDQVKLVGYAAVFDRVSELWGGFREVVRPGAFQKTIQESDIRALWNHNSDLVLGRRQAGTLELEEDEKGLRVTIYPPSSASREIESIERGDVSQMSIGFRAVRDAYQNDEDTTLRELLEVEVFDVSPVAYPAYEDTEIGLRELKREVLEERGLTPDEIRGIFDPSDSDLVLGGGPGPCSHSLLEVEIQERELRIREQG